MQLIEATPTQVYPLHDGCILMIGTPELGKRCGAVYLTKKPHYTRFLYVMGKDDVPVYQVELERPLTDEERQHFEAWVQEWQQRQK